VDTPVLDERRLQVMAEPAAMKPVSWNDGKEGYQAITYLILDAEAVDPIDYSSREVVMEGLAREDVFLRYRGGGGEFELASF